jgi:hypothetical protein
MKYLFLSMIVALAGLLTNCSESHASPREERPPENGAQFKKGEGLSLTDEMARSIKLQTAEVIEEKIAAVVPVTLRPLPGGSEAAGWLDSTQASKVQPGFVVKLQGGSSALVKSVRKSDFAALDEHEAIITSDTNLPVGSELQGTILLPELEAGASIPQSALLKTAEGNFVYAKNGKFFVRTPVTVGASNGSRVEITDGLYSGDEVVTSPVMSLWMAELQVLRGGKACTCGH